MVLLLKILVFTMVAPGTVTVLLPMMLFRGELDPAAVRGFPGGGRARNLPPVHRALRGAGPCAALRGGLRGVLPPRAALAAAASAWKGLKSFKRKDGSDETHQSTTDELRTKQLGPD